MRLENTRCRGNAVADATNPDWMNHWQAMARQYASNWQNAPSAAAPEPAGQVQGFEQWSRIFAPGAGSQGESIERLVDSTKNYVAGMQAMLAAATANAQGGNVPWAAAFAQGFANPGVNAPLFDHPAATAWRQMAAQGGDGQLPFAGALQVPPPAVLGELKAWLRLPTFGSSREQQEHYQKTAVAAVEYQEQMNRYNALMLRASQRGFALFEGKLGEREQPGRQIESLRALYDLWVDAAEEGYAEVALSTEFREVYGALVNAQMRARALVQHDVERIGAELGMPTRTEVNSIGERLQALRREVRARGDDALASEVSSLRKELAALKDDARRAQPHPGRVELKSAKAGRKVTATTKRAPSSASASKKTSSSANAGDAAMAPTAPNVSAKRILRTPQRPPASTSRSPAKTPARKKTAMAKARAAAGPKPSALRSSAVPSKGVAAKAPGARNFASRIAKFANTSLGTSRARTPLPEKRPKSRPVKTR